MLLLLPPLLKLCISNTCDLILIPDDPLVVFLYSVGKNVSFLLQPFAKLRISSVVLLCQHHITCH